jgi:DNA-binding NarL/FixJ family response regulator
MNVTKKGVLLAKMPPLWAGLLTNLIDDQPDMEVVGEVSDVVELLRIIRQAEQAEISVVLLPLTAFGELPGVCSHLVAEHPDLRVIVLSLTGESLMVHTVEWVVTDPVENLLSLIRTTCPCRE